MRTNRQEMKVMTGKFWAIGLGLMAVAGCEPYANTIPATERPQLVAPANMPEACRRSAAVKYAQLPENMSVAPAVQQPNQTWLVSGQYTSMNGVRVFECQFTGLGNMTGVYRS
jgi:hypothetical protein